MATIIRAPVRPLLSVRDLSVTFATRGGPLRAVDRASLDVAPGEIVGLVGESGSGKSTVGLSLMSLLPGAATLEDGSSIVLNERELASLRGSELRAIRGREIAMTFQDPMTFLNPLVRVGDQIAEAVRQHQGLRGREADAVALQAIRDVQITEPERVFGSYPFQLSGGMRQRLLIAIALSCRPKLLIADEPTTALDVTVQREILDLLVSVRARFDTAILLITHDLGVVAEVCDRVYVMYAGQVFEHGAALEVLSTPRNPYTAALLRSARSIDEFEPVLYALEGSVPSPMNPPTGCRFRERCPSAFDRCVEPPPLFATPSGSSSRCWLADPAGRGADE
jgi:peptide/nickel transport system ATP-binding protein